jgi:glycosyltransferase involved in cell wall biosynthesis
MSTLWKPDAEGTDLKLPPEVSVVIPTRDRPNLLLRALGAVLEQDTKRSFEVIVVNDGHHSELPSQVSEDARVLTVKGAGLGPAHARNLGIGMARAPIVLLTDDDALVDHNWLESAVRALESSPEAVGVEGRVESPQFDPLYEHSVRTDVGGGYFTCNIAYRRDDLLALGGFDSSFPFPHCEDRDMGLRMMQRGPILFVPEMKVVHPPRPLRLRQAMRRGRFVESDWLLHKKHPETRPPRWSIRWGPTIRMARYWQRAAANDPTLLRDPRRLLRFVVLAGGQLLFAFGTTIRKGGAM